MKKTCSGTHEKSVAKSERFCSSTNDIDEKVSDLSREGKSKKANVHILRRRAVKPWKTKVALELACFNHTTSSTVILQSSLQHVKPHECYSKEEEMYLHSTGSKGVSQKKMEWLQNIIVLLFHPQ